MKKKSILISTTLCAALVLAAGCGKKETTPETPAEEAAEPSSRLVAEIKTTAQETANTAAQETREAAEAMKATAAKTMEDVKTTVNEQAQGLIDKAKALVADSKYAEATDALKKLSDFKLTPEQQKLVDDLKAQIQKALSGTETGKAIGNLLGQPK